MESTGFLKRLLLYAVLSFTCGVLLRTVYLNCTKPDFVFYRTFEPQFALVAEEN